MRRSKRLPIAALLATLSACSFRGGPADAGNAGAAAWGSASSAGSSGNAGANAAASGTTFGSASGSAGALPTGSTGGSEPSGGAAGRAEGPTEGVGGAAMALPKLVTSTEGAYWQTDELLVEVSGATADVTIDEGALAQVWQGFGGTFSERGGETLSLLSPSDQQQALALLFGQDGLRFNYGRIPVGSSDYAIDRYSLDETPDDTAMAQFSIERDKQQLIPYLKAALGVAPNLHLWASPWSPPTWMKSNLGFDSGAMNEDDVTLQAYALYLTKFVQEYAKQGISIEALHPQKEPTLGLDFPSCTWSAAGMNKFIGAHLGPMFAQQNLSTEIFLGSLSEDGGVDKALEIINAVTADATPMKYIKGFGFEWQGLSLVAAVKSQNMPIWQDNHNVGNLPWGTPFDRTAAPNDHAYAVASWGLIRDWIHAGVTAYFTSNMILDAQGMGIGDRAWPQNALLVVTRPAKRFRITPAFHLFRHLSAFVAPGAHVIATSGGDALAFKNPDGGIIVVLYNAEAAKPINVAVRGKLLHFQMPANGWATLRAN